MSVKRDRPESSIPGQLHTPDGRTVRVRLPEGLQPPVALHESTEQRPRPEAPEDPRAAPFRAAPPYGA